jgi:hypothetical protein
VRYNHFWGELNAKVDKEDTFKSKTKNDSLHKINNDNDVKVVNYATSKNLVVQMHNVPSPRHS